VVRRVVEEDVTTPSTTVVEDDGSWIGRTIVTLVVLALLVAGAVWLVQTLSNNDNGIGDRDNTNIELNQDQPNQDTDTNNTVPSANPS
jgi:hypothetical protein